MSPRGYDFTLTIDESGIASSAPQDASRIDSFAVLCDDIAQWNWAIDDENGYPISSSDGTTNTITGKAGVPINRPCFGFVFKMTGATPGTYKVRVYGY